MTGVAHRDHADPRLQRASGRRQMADGLNTCLERYPEWPPAAAQFRAVCLGKVVDKDGNEIWEHGTAAYKYFDRSTAIEDLTTKQKRKENGQKECSKLLELFDDD